MSRPCRRRGIALLVVLSVLALMSLMGIAFMNLTVIDQQVSRSYLDEIRARLVARAGLEYAADQIMGQMERGYPDHPCMIYWGSNATEQGSPDWKTPLDRAINPSYAWEDEPQQNPDDENRAPLLLSLDGKSQGFSGKLTTGSHSANGDLFRLRVFDCNSAIHVNDGLEHGPEGPVSRNLQRILNTLGDILNVPELGRKILERRPKEGYRSRKELETALGRTEYLKVAPHVSVRAWSDPNVVNPVPLSQETLDSYPVQYNDKIAMYRYGRGRDAEGLVIDQPLVWAPDYADGKGVNHAINGLDEINPQWIERTRRSPVNLNLATKEVLTALISGLRGWFVVERRKHNPAANEYSFMFHTRYDNRPGQKLGDEYGWLYSTIAFLGPTNNAGGTQAYESGGTTGVRAEDVAEEMVRCRDRKQSKFCQGIDYGSVWFGGPFRSWRQFNAFVDHFVTSGWFKDPRDIFYDFEHPEGGSGPGWWGGNPSGSDNLYSNPSPIQQKWAAQAMADVLKANFNPNCTLNETNPDHTLYLIVDKTDLICNSTEFCFTPMGLFEVESEGLVVQAQGGTDLLQTRRGHVVARRKFDSVVKAYDAYRETSQEQFYSGRITGRPGGTPATNTNRTLELGPEPDNGPAASECRYSGWIQLATMGGHWSTPGPTHLPKTMEENPKTPAERGAVLHGHFTYDCRLNHHADDERDIVLGSSWLKNSPDRTEKFIGPYVPNLNGPGHYRLARDYEGDRIPGNADYHAPLDLRLDGAYVERDCALMYAISKKVIGTAGTVSYWIKPSYRPEMTGKPRTYFCIDAVGDGPFGPGKQMINGQWFFPSADAPPYAKSPNEAKNPVYPFGPWRPACFVGGFAPNGFGGIGIMSPSLNHRAHADQDEVDQLAAHRWTHVTYWWDGQALDCNLWVNGVPCTLPDKITVHPSPCTHDDWMQKDNLIRFGEPSRTMEHDSIFGMSSTATFSRNWAADATIDEIFLWQGKQIDQALDVYGRGRYYRPKPRREGQFTSAPLRLTDGARKLAPPSAASAPADGRETVAQGSSAGGTQASPTPTARILAAAWTWYPPIPRPDGKPVVHDYFDDRAVSVEVEFRIVRDNAEVTEAAFDDGGAYALNVTMADGEDVRYRFKIRIPSVTPNSILLDTPAIDDVTIYYTTGAEYLTFETEESQ